MSAPWPQVREVFEAALDESNPQAWLEQQVLDSAVRHEVASLLESGTLVGHYKIGRELGRGAMGRVYLATDTRLGRAVALKALAPHLTGDASHRERLRREARAAAALTHSGICTVYALEEIDGQLFIASELVEGRTLREEMSGGSQPAPEAIAATAHELADALASAHAKGITHRDFKPENVMRDASGRLKVLDFGLARIQAAPGEPGADRATVAGALVGTPAYMSPEQLNGQPADARSDVFAFGVVLYEFASGAHPFQASTPLSLAARVLESEADPLAMRSRNVPATVAAVVDRCLQKAPDSRFASASDIVAALRQRVAPASASVSSFLAMWRAHQLVTMVLYIAVTAVAWSIKELLKPNPVPLAIFVALGIGAAAAGVMRGHLLFTSALNQAHLRRERAHLRPSLVAIDVLMAAGGALAGLGVVSLRPLSGVLTVGLAIGLALATIVIEPATSRAAFPE